MPLLKGSSRAIVASNIAELRRAGHSEKQAIAVAMKVSNKHRAASKKSKKV